jgi:hypothetical protein
VPAIPRIDQLSGDADTLADLAYAPLKNEVHAEFGGHLLHLYGLALVSEGRIARDDVEVRYFGEVRDDVLGDAVRKVLLLSIAAHIGEWQHGDELLLLFLGCGQSGLVHFQWQRPPWGDRINSDRLLDVLEPVLTTILERQIEP